MFLFSNETPMYNSEWSRIITLYSLFPDGQGAPRRSRDCPRFLAPLHAPEGDSQARATVRLLRDRGFIQRHRQSSQRGLCCITGPNWELLGTPICTYIFVNRRKKWFTSLYKEIYLACSWRHLLKETMPCWCCFYACLRLFL